MPDIEEDDSCLIPDAVIAARAKGLTDMDPINTQAAIVYLLATMIKTLDAELDYTDICALAKSLQAHDSFPSYELNGARIHAWEEVSESVTNTEPDWNAIKEAIRCAHCCDITPTSMQSAMTFLLCTLGTLLNET